MKRALLLQGLSCFALGLAAYLLRPLAFVHTVLLWVTVPLCGFGTSFHAVRKGVNPYLAWLLPPLMLTLSSVIVTLGYLPGGGIMLLTAFLSLIGSAAGETYLNRKRKKHEYKR